jgi:hypothetical protein
MGDRCYIEITLRRDDLRRFGEHIYAGMDESWWDDLTEDEAQPDIVTVSAYEANYAWFNERAEAAKAGISFFGQHAQGDEYGAYAFASWHGELHEAPLDRNGNIIVAVDDNLDPIGDIQHLLKYVAIRNTVQAAFAMGQAAGKAAA